MTTAISPAAMFDAVRSVVPHDSHVLKVILETGELVAPSSIRAAAQLAVTHALSRGEDIGFDYVRHDGIEFQIDEIALIPTRAIITLSFRTKEAKF